MRARDYLSHSQKILWKKNPKEYILRYIWGKKQYVTKEMNFGTLVANLLEKGELCGDLHLDITVANIPHFEVNDKEHRCNLKLGKNIVPLLAKMDSRKEDFTAFKEYKTGKTPWTQKKVDEDPQVTFYATYCEIQTGKIPDDIELIWIPTEEIDGKITVIGEVVAFKTKRTKAQIIQEKADMLKVWREIGEACEKELL